MSQRKHSPQLMSIWLSLVTIPWISSLLMTQKLAEELLEMGKASEEIFRGDRLPILPFPASFNEDENG